MRALSTAVCAMACAAVVLPSRVGAQQADAGVPVAPIGPASPGQGAQEAANGPPVARVYTGSAGELELGGWVEAFWQWNANQPSNGVTANRSFDDRAQTFVVSNVVTDAQWSLDRMTARITLQIGHTPDLYYASEPSLPAVGGAVGSDRTVWKFIQQAIVGWTAPVGTGLLVEAGLFLSPIGAEGLAIKEQWNWSRSDLFFALPAYHTGVRATYGLAPHLTASAGVYNGWNSVLDNNEEKSVSAQLAYSARFDLSFRLVYFGGVERPTGAPHGRAWRHLFDAWVMWYPTRWLTLMVHGDAGFEDNAFGTDSWESVALYLRLKLARWFRLTARIDAFSEQVPTGSDPIFFGARFVSSATLTLDVRPAPNISVRLELRHDQANGPIYFAGAVPADGSANAASQDTILLGVTTWF